jgi:hypothetical protein
MSDGEQCGCGRPTRHSGYCRTRRAESEGPSGVREGLRHIEELHLAAIRFESWRARWTARGRPTLGLTSAPRADDEDES